MQHAVDGADFEHVQLAEGRFQGTLGCAHLERSGLDWGSYNLPLLARGTMPPDRVTLGFIVPGGGGDIFNGFRVSHFAPVAMSEGSELHFQLSRATQWTALQVSRDDIERMGLMLPTPCSAVVEAEHRERILIRDSIARAIAWLKNIERDSDTILDRKALGIEIQENLLAAFARALEPDRLSFARCTPHRAARLRIVRTAQEYFDAHLGEPIRIADLCAATHSTIKTLERTFIAMTGTTPKRHLTLMRLAKARRLLQQGASRDTSVAKSATSCGFLHLGRFAAAYRSLYAETPSETLLGKNT